MAWLPGLGGSQATGAASLKRSLTCIGLAPDARATPGPAAKLLPSIPSPPPSPPPAALPPPPPLLAPLLSLPAVLALKPELPRLPAVPSELLPLPASPLEPELPEAASLPRLPAVPDKLLLLPASLPALPGLPDELLPGRMPGGGPARTAVGPGAMSVGLDR